jgi:NADH-quinone oxidoreductase subunit J
MMLDIDFAALRSGFTKNLPFGLIVALVLLAEIIVAVSAWKAGPVTGGAQPVTTTQPNIEAVGELLYTRYLFPFEIAGLVLLVAMIGAIVLTHRSRGDVRKQNASKQIRRRPEDAVQLKQPTVGEGMKL